KQFRRRPHAIDDGQKTGENHPPNGIHVLHLKWLAKGIDAGLRLRLGLDLYRNRFTTQSRFERF
ncbi:MAG: hypothetical protein ACREC4_08030, partial [Methylocella sp.]